MFKTSFTVAFMAAFFSLSHVNVSGALGRKAASWDDFKTDRLSDISLLRRKQVQECADSDGKVDEAGPCALAYQILIDRAQADITWAKFRMAVEKVPDPGKRAKYEQAAPTKMLSDSTFINETLANSILGIFVKSKNSAGSK